MAVSFFMVGVWEMMLLTGIGGGGVMGMPPGERDAALLKSAPANAIVYAEWAERSTGEPGAPGIDGLAADPEIREFLADIDRAIRTTIENESANSPPEAQILAKAVPPLVKTLLMRPGCLYAWYDDDAAKAGKETPAAEQMGDYAGLLGFQVVLIVDGGKDAETIAKSIKQLNELLPAENRSDDLKHQKLPIPLEGITVELHREGDRFIIGYGSKAVETAVNGLKNGDGGLAKNEAFAESMKRVSLERVAGVSYIDVKGALDAASKALGKRGLMVKPVATMIGANAIDSLATSTGVVDGQVAGRSFLKTNGKTEGILVLAAGRAIEAKDFANIPGDADLVVAFSLNLPKILATAKRLVALTGEESSKQFDKTLEQLETEVGVSLEDDVFEAFGEVWTIHNSPSGTGPMFASPVLSLEVRDPQKAYKVLTQLMQVVRNALPGDVRGGFRRRSVNLAQSKFMDRTVYFINTVGDDVPFAPSFCATDKELLVSLHPQAIKAHLRFQKDGPPAGASEGGELFSDVFKSMSVPEGELICFSRCEAKKAYSAFYAFAPWFGQLAFSEFQREGAGINIFSLPSARAVLPYLGDSHSAVVRTPEGIYSESNSAFPLPMSAGSSVASMLLGFGMMIPARRRFEPAQPAGDAVDEAAEEKSNREGASLNQKGDVFNASPGERGGVSPPVSAAQVGEHLGDATHPIQATSRRDRSKTARRFIAGSGNPLPLLYSNTPSLHIPPRIPQPNTICYLLSAICSKRASVL